MSGSAITESRSYTAETCRSGDLSFTRHLRPHNPTYEKATYDTRTVFSTFSRASETFRPSIQRTSGMPNRGGSEPSLPVPGADPLGTLPCKGKASGSNCTCRAGSLFFDQKQIVFRHSTFPTVSNLSHCRGATPDGQRSHRKRDHRYVPPPHRFHTHRAGCIQVEGTPYKRETVIQTTVRMWQAPGPKNRPSTDRRAGRENARIPPQGRKSREHGMDRPYPVPRKG